MMNFAAYLPSGDMTEEKWGILLSSVADAMRVANTSPRGLCDAAHAEWVLAAIIDTHAQPTAMNKRHAVFTKNNWANTPFSKAQLRHALKWCKETTGEGEEKAGVFANMMGGLAARPVASSNPQLVKVPALELSIQISTPETNLRNISLPSWIVKSKVV